MTELSPNSAAKEPPDTGMCCTLLCCSWSDEGGAKRCASRWEPLCLAANVSHCAGRCHTSLRFSIQAASHHSSRSWWRRRALRSGPCTNVLRIEPRKSPSANAINEPACQFSKTSLAIWPGRRAAPCDPTMTVHWLHPRARAASAEICLAPHRSSLHLPVCRSRKPEETDASLFAFVEARRTTRHVFILFILGPCATPLAVPALLAVSLSTRQQPSSGRRLLDRCSSQLPRSLLKTN